MALILAGCTPPEVPPVVANVGLMSESQAITRAKIGMPLRIGGDEIELYGVTMTQVSQRISFQQFYKSSWEICRLSNFVREEYDGYLLRINGRATSSDVEVDIGGVKAALADYRDSNGNLIFTDPSFDREPFDRPNVGTESPLYFDISQADVQLIKSVGEIASLLSDDIVYLYFDFESDKGVVVAAAK